MKDFSVFFKNHCNTFSLYKAHILQDINRISGKS